MFDGQSLNNYPDGNSCYPFQTMTGVSTPWTIAAVSGWSFTQLATTAPTRLWPLANQFERTILVLAGGTSDIMTQYEANSGAQAYADMIAYSRAARQAGFDRVVATTIADAQIFTADEQVRRLDFNQRIRSSPEFDAVADIGGCPELAGRPDATCFSDGIHWNAAGATRAAELVRPALLGQLTTI